MAKEKMRVRKSSEEDRTEYDRHVSDAAEGRGRKTLGGTGITIALIAAIVIIALGVYLVIGHKTYFNDYEVLAQTATGDATRMTYLPYNHSLIKYSQEGITCLDKNGQAVWVESYKMKQPVAVVSGEYIAVADYNGNSVYVFNSNGKISSMETPYIICNIDVASQGVFAVVLENETENFIELYDKNGTNLAEIRTTIADSGYPMDISISDDGKKMVTSYITVNGVTIENSIAMYNFGEVGQNVTDRLVGGFNNLEDTMVPKVEFLNNDTICAFGDNRFQFYSMKEKPSEKGTVSDFQGEVQSIFYNSRYVGIVEKGSSVPTEDNEQDGIPQYVIRVFDTNGSEKFSRTLEYSYNDIYATENEIIVIGTSECRIYDFSGNLKFSYAFNKEVKHLVPTGNSLQYIVVFDDSTEMIKLQYTKEETEEVQ